MSEDFKLEFKGISRTCGGDPVFFRILTYKILVFPAHAGVIPGTIILMMKSFQYFPHMRG